jgi:hypothetical protein
MAEENKRAVFAWTPDIPPDPEFPEEAEMSDEEWERHMSAQMKALAAWWKAREAQQGYVTAGGNKYHTAGCRHLTATKRALPLSEAVKRYEPCKACRPPVLK